jgi:hypothetical protein
VKNTHFLPERTLTEPKNAKLKTTLPTHRSFRCGLLIFALIVSLLAVQGTQAWASTTGGRNFTLTQMTSTVSTNRFSVYLVYPSSAYAGESEVVAAVTTARSSGTVVSLSIDVFSYVNGRPVRIASETILANTHVQAGNKWRTFFVVTIPANAQSGPLFGTITEVWQQPQSYYSSNYISPPYSATAYCTQNYPYYSTHQTQSYPSHSRNIWGSSHSSIEPNTYQGAYVYQGACVCQPSYVSQPEPYYVPNDAPNYATQATSQQTFTLTHVLGQ